MIDAHVHIGGEGAGFVMNEELVLCSMEKYKIDISIVSNGDSVEYGEDFIKLPEKMQISQEETLARVIQFCRENPGRVYGAFWCKPHHELVTVKIEKMIADNRDVIVALKVHPTLSNLSFSDEKMYPYFKLAEKYDLPIMVHTANDEVANPMRVYEIACRYPNLKFIMAHMGLGTDNKMAVDLMGKAANLYADTAWVPVETVLEIIRKYGSERVMFGSDNPIDGLDTYYCNPWGEPSLYRQYFGPLKEMISREDYENLMEKTACKVFGISIAERGFIGNKL